MGDTLTAKLDEIEDLAHADIENEWDDRLARGALALVAAVRAGITLREDYQMSPQAVRERLAPAAGTLSKGARREYEIICDVDDALRAIEELTL